jgi:hypothetical protein
MLHHYFRPCSSPPPSIADDTGFIQPVLYGDWPLLADFKAMRLADYNWLLSATAQQVRQAGCDYTVVTFYTVFVSDMQLADYNWLLGASAQQVRQAGWQTLSCTVLYRICGWLTATGCWAPLHSRWVGQIQQLTAAAESECKSMM